MSNHRPSAPAVDSLPDQKLSRREAQKVLTRNRVIEAALEVFDERSFAATTMDDIAARANLNRGTIYLHFDSKAEILGSALRNMETDGIELISEFYTAQSRAQLEATYDHVLTVWSRVGRVWRHARDGAATDAPLREWSEAVFSRQVRQARRAFEERGMNSSTADVRATLVVSMFSEFMTRWPAKPSPRKRQATIAALADLLEAAQKVSGTPPDGMPSKA